MSDYLISKIDSSGVGLKKSHYLPLDKVIIVGFFFDFNKDSLIIIY